MKKIVLTLLAVVCTASAFGQTTSFGIRGGLNYSTQTGHKLAFGKLPGFTIGGILNYQFDNFALQPGVFFSVKGFREKVQVVDVTNASINVVNSDVKLNYLEIPLNFIYKIPTKKAVRFFVGCGPFVGYALSGSIATDRQPKKDVSFEDDYHVDFGLDAIAGVEVLKKVIISANYDFSVADVDQVQTHNNTNNRTLGFSIGYLF